jgi:hypothetical protein
VAIVFLVFAFFTKEAIRFAVACFTFVTDVSNGTFPRMLFLGVWAAAFEADYQFRITTTSFDRVSETVATITLGKWGVGDELLSGSALAEKRGRIANHKF